MKTLRRLPFQTWSVLLGALAATGLLLAATDPAPGAPDDPSAPAAASLAADEVPAAAPAAPVAPAVPAATPATPATPVAPVAPVALPAAGPAGEENRYVGADKCKACHKAETGGDQYGHWTKSEHAKAYEALASEAAKKAAKDKGIEDPQSSEACVKCHSTGYGQPEEAFAKGFKPELGVQCESCHGMGEKHVKARFAAAMKAKDGQPEPPPPGEIVTRPDATVCTGCHNAESPTFEGFCFKTYSRVIRHLDPRRELSDERKAEMEGPCEHGEECPYDPAGPGGDK
jgi:hypothetical protein